MTLLTHTWWEFPSRNASAFHVAYRSLNLIEGSCWFLFAAWVLARFLRHRHTFWELLYSFAFLTFGISDFIEAHALTTWLIFAKGPEPGRPPRTAVLFTAHPLPHQPPGPKKPYVRPSLPNHCAGGCRLTESPRRLPHAQSSQAKAAALRIGCWQCNNWIAGGPHRRTSSFLKKPLAKRAGNLIARGRAQPSQKHFVAENSS
jgi:hypothetical protein